MADGSARTGANAIPVFSGTANPSPPTPVPATIAASGVYTSGPIVNNSGAKAVAVSAQLTQAGLLSVQLYLDVAGTIPIGNPVNQALTANVLGTVQSNDGTPFASFIVTISNAGGVTGTLSKVIILVQ